jgi:hypothetical protein
MDEGALMTTEERHDEKAGRQSAQQAIGEFSRIFS